MARVAIYQRNRLKWDYLLALDLEARSGFEPLNKGFADLCLTTWLPRLLKSSLLGTYRAGQLKSMFPLRSTSAAEAAGRTPLYSGMAEL